MQMIVDYDSKNNLKDYSNSNDLKESSTKMNSKPKSKIKILLIIIASLVVLISITFVIIYFFIILKKDEKQKVYEKENLIVNIGYKPNIVYHYILNKRTQTNVVGAINPENSTKEIKQFFDFFLLIEKENIEKDEIKLEQKKWFTGYLAILNASINYEINNTQILENKYLYSILNEEKEINSMENSTSFVKVDFYENGDIINFYTPINNFPILYMQYIKEYSKLIFPKISSELYSNNIEESLNKLIEQENNVQNEYTRKLYEEGFNNKLKSYKIISDNNNNDSQEFEMEESIVSSNDKSKYYDLREKSNNSNEINLIEFSMENLESKEANLKNSELNKTINTSINKDGLLESVTQIERAIIVNEENNGEDISEIIHNNKSDINFDIKSMSFETFYELNIKDNFTNKKIINNLLNVFQNTKYVIFNETFYNEYMSSLIKEKIIKENNISNDNIIPDLTNENNLRSTSSNNYYGMNKLINEKDLYSYNLLGLKMQKQIFNEIEPSTGKSSTYSNLVFGNINKKIKTGEQHTNLHIILEKKNQMAFNLIQLLHKTNLDLKERNKNISQIIINLEINILDSFKEYDYSNSFNECLVKVSEQLKSFASDLFDKLIILINNLYENYIYIFDEIKNDKYEVFKQIMKITKNEYMNYINEMGNKLEQFSKETLLFLNSIEKEVTSLEKIEKIDFLYDILNNIYESKLLLIQFNSNLFKAIEKGILTFKTNINEYKETLIGDLLYITDFLSVNIVKNEIIIRTYDEKTLKDLSIKLKNFRNIIQNILDDLIKNINSDYEFEMSQDNNSIKILSESKAIEQYNKIDKNSNNLVNKIKNKIEFNDLYEIYSSIIVLLLI